MKLYLGPNTLLFPQTCYLEDPELMATSGRNILRNAYIDFEKIASGLVIYIDLPMLFWRVIATAR